MATFSDIRQFMLGQAFGSPHIPKDADFSGKTLIITGANSGIGFECAKHLARLNAQKLILGCRSSEKGNAAKNAISAQTGNGTTLVEVWKLDLASYESVLAFGKRVQSQVPRLDAFVANAGVEPVVFTLAEDLETTLTVNVVSTMLLNILILPKLRATSAEFGIPTILTTVGSSVHIFGKTDNLLDLPRDELKDTFTLLSDSATADLGGPDAQMSPRYALSKTMLHAVLPHLAAKASRSAQNEQVIVNWVNPGWCASELSRHKKGQSRGTKISFALIGRTAEQGGRELVSALLAGRESHGHYMSECRGKPESTFLRSEKGLQFGQRLWQELMARIVNISPETTSIVG